MRLFGSRRAVTADTPLEGTHEMRPRGVAELSAAEIQASIDRALRIRDRLLARSSRRWGTGGWPERLPDGEIGIVLPAYPAGRVGPALAAAKIVYEPTHDHHGCGRDNIVAG